MTNGSTQYFLDQVEKSNRMDLFIVENEKIVRDLKKEVVIVLYMQSDPNLLLCIIPIQAEKLQGEYNELKAETSQRISDLEKGIVEKKVMIQMLEVKLFVLVYLMGVLMIPSPHRKEARATKCVASCLHSLGLGSTVKS